MLIKNHSDNDFVPFPKNSHRRPTKSLNPVEKPQNKISATIMPPLNMIHHLYSPPSSKIHLDQSKTSNLNRNGSQQNIENNNLNYPDFAGKSFSAYKMPNTKLLGRHSKQNGNTFDEIPRAGSETPVSMLHNEKDKITTTYLNKMFSDKQSESKPRNLPSISGHLYSLSTAEDWSSENKPSEILKKKLECMISKQKSEKSLKKDKKEVMSVKFLNHDNKEEKMPLISSNSINVRLAALEDPMKKKLEKNFILVQKISDLRHQTKDLPVEPRYSGGSGNRASSVDKKNNLLREPLIGGVNSHKIQALRDTIVRTIKKQESDLKNLSRDDMNKDMLDPKLKELEVSVIAKATVTDNLNVSEGEIENILNGID